MTRTQIETAKFEEFFEALKEMASNRASRKNKQ